MCRPERPISTDNKALRALQEWLRAQKARMGQDYRTLSVRAGCHATTLQRAASDDAVPTLQTVHYYARACDASPDEAKRLWKAARYEATRTARGGRGLAAPRPEFIRDFVDLSAALQDLYERAGSPSLRTMEKRAGKYGVLSRSTTYRIIHKRTVPRGLPQFKAFLKACEVPEADWVVWEAAWARAWRQEKQEDIGTFPMPVTPSRVASLGDNQDRLQFGVPVHDVDILEALLNARGARRSGPRRVRRAQARREQRALELLGGLEALLKQSALAVNLNERHPPHQPTVRLMPTQRG